MHSQFDLHQMNKAQMKAAIYSLSALVFLCAVLVLLFFPFFSAPLPSKDAALQAAREAAKEYIERHKNCSNEFNMNEKINYRQSFFREGSAVYIVNLDAVEKNFGTGGFLIAVWGQTSIFRYMFVQRNDPTPIVDIVGSDFECRHKP